MIQLRGGQLTRHRSLDRVVYYDPRSRQYPVRSLVGGLQPRTHAWACNAHLDQGREGACVGFGITHELISEPAVVAGRTEATALQLYKAAKEIDPFPGDEYEGTTVLAGMEVVRRQGWIDGYYWAFGLDDLIVGISHHGPAVMGLAWFEGMRDPDAAGFIRVTGGVLGGHCLLCKGVDVEGKYFIMHNSWGPGWGLDGDAFISFSDMDKLLSENGEAAFFVGRHREARV